MDETYVKVRLLLSLLLKSFITEERVARVKTDV